MWLDYFEKGFYEESIMLFKKVLEINTNETPSYTNWGLALNELGKYEEAISKYEKL